MDKTIKEQLVELADADYQKFSAALLPTIDNVIGVRLPELRKLAKTIAKGDWRAYLEQAESDYFEEIMLQGMVLGYVKTDLEEILHYMADFIPKIDNWSVCDSFCTGLKFTRKNKEQMWDFIVPYLSSEKEYEIRFAVVMMLNFFIEEAYIRRILQLLDKVRHEGYYVKMAVSWALSMCYVKLPAATIDYLRTNNLDDFTYNKALQKITESYRVDPETKKMIRGMKRNRKNKPLM
ncbi:DNA alkylation repair protein [Paenibacillus sp. FSL R5-0345]|uniref:DNA alkylation repair protein n=1 Tax=unclassified Paenibacillus TaxID=185978 RepID=UPI0004F722D6|nr:DNA alkylation repair protein [Paenibacillus sp. FSL R5-0345]AIQ34411.1 DNA alkylation repair protein [Paenibacillus sp. FSL R5-0345]